MLDEERCTIYGYGPENLLDLLREKKWEFNQFSAISFSGNWLHNHPSEKSVHYSIEIWMFPDNDVFRVHGYGFNVGDKNFVELARIHPEKIKICDKTLEDLTLEQFAKRENIKGYRLTII
ncbi:MAG: hypothetical protein HY507_01080, partial [Candidatus Zambryskibacteria bacterium]|nr:hypothetical protein [Candidatus Zambryskibacteria bacterium]